MNSWQLAEGIVLDLKAGEAERMADWLDAAGKQQNPPPPHGGKKFDRWVEEIFQAKLVLIMCSDCAINIRNLLAFKKKLLGR